MVMRCASKRGKERMRFPIAMNPEDPDGFVWTWKSRLEWEDLLKSRRKPNPWHDGERSAVVSSSEPAGTCWLRTKEKKRKTRKACGILLTLLGPCN